MADYFMNTYHVIIDDTMIQNMAETNVGESLDLLTFKLVIYVLFLGVLPSFVIYKIKITFGTFKKELWITLKTLLFCIVVNDLPLNMNQIQGRILKL